MIPNDHPIIKLERVGKAFPGPGGDRLMALEDVSFEVQDGEFLAIIGPSGCGKSTLLKLIGGLDEPTAGNVEVLETDPLTARRRRCFGCVFQDPVLFEWRTALQNVRLPGEIFHDEEITRAAGRYLQLVGLEGFGSVYPAQLSGGMKSRVALARALSFHPRILLMDEAFGNLDELTRFRMNMELLSVREKVLPTILFVTHSVHEAVFCADRILVLSPRPARVAKTYSVDLPRPRGPETTEQPPFLALVRSLRAELGLTNHAGNPGRQMPTRGGVAVEPLETG